MSMSYSTGRLYTITGREQASDTSDVALLRSISAGDKHAMQTLFACHNVRVFRFLLRFVADRRGSRWRGVLGRLAAGGKIRGRSQVTTWLLAIARYKALSTLQRRSIEELGEDVAAAIEDPQDNPEVMNQNRQTSEILLNCLTQLSPAHREVIDLVYYHEKSIDEVAEITGIPPNTVKTRMFYARKRIAELMAAQGIDRSIV